MGTVMHRLTGLLFFVVLAFLATVALERPDVVVQVTEELTAGYNLYVLFVLGGCVLFYSFLGLFPKKRDTFLTFDAPDGGVVSISTNAICDYLAQLDSEFPSVVRLRPRVVTRRQTVDVICEVRVKSDAQVHDVCHVLQKRVRERLTDGLGLTEVRRIEVSVREIVTERRSS